MAKYLLFWKSDQARIPVDPKERLAGWIKSLSMVKADVASGRIKDWGAFPGEHAGYAIMEGTDQEVLIGTEKYAPFVRFKTHSALTVDQALESMNAAKEQFVAAQK